MRKLLLIFLLLFPVHGALGEMLTIKCIPKKLCDPNKGCKITPPDPINIYNFDLEKSTVDGWPLYQLSDHYILWHWRKTSKKAGEYFMEYNAINRYEGELRSDLSVYMSQEESLEFLKKGVDEPADTRATIVAQCKKISDKKKF